MPVLSIFAALAAAVSFAMAAVLQQEAARSTSLDTSLRLRLLVVLLHRPKWLAGVSLLISGYGLQALALSAGPVSLVQPIVATELAFAIPIGISRRHRAAGRREWLGIAAVLVGVSTLLLAAQPVAGKSQPDKADWLWTLIPVGSAIALLLFAAVRTTSRYRAVLLGCAAGLAFSLLAALTKAVTHNLAVDVGSTFTNWEVYAVIGLGITALVISQSAYQAGPLALSMPAIAILEPTVAVIIGDTAFSEQAHLSGGALALELLAALVAAVGLMALATSPVVGEIYAQSQPPTSTSSPGGDQEPPPGPTPLSPRHPTAHTAPRPDREAST